MHWRVLLTAALAPALVLAATAPAALADAPANATRSTLDRVVPAALTAHKIPSVSIAEIRHGRVVLTTAYGFQSTGVRATPRTLYNIASLTKPLTAEVILRLASANALGLDESMTSAWTDPDIAGDARTKRLTPRLALSHRTGFPNWRANTGLKFLRDPGGEPGYSGEGYNYVARFAEKKTGRGFEDLAQTYLFGPAGMHSTAYTSTGPGSRVASPCSLDASGAALAPHVAKHFNCCTTSTSMTAGDYAAFMVQVLKDRALSDAVAQERDRVQATTPAKICRGDQPSPACPLNDGFGLGWEVMTFKRGTVFMHTGKDGGLFTFAYIDRATGDGVVILTNSDNGAGAVMPVLEATHADPAFVAYLKAQMG